VISGLLGEQAVRLRPVFRIVVRVTQAGQAEEDVGEGRVAVVWDAVGKTAVALDDLDVALEAGPAREAVLARYHQLRRVHGKPADLGARVWVREVFGGLG